jgi:energy-coupling factor transporter ATP-binding protein EcfA2
MHADLLAVVDAFDRVIAAAEGVVEPAVLDPVAETVRAVRRRAGYLGDTVVAAVAGGTGSGKSSLVNALAGEIVSEPGGMRPTTGTPLAWIPSNPEPGLVRLLDDLGVTARVGQDHHDWLALIDLPDTDSVVVDHRHRVDALLPKVDLVLWVIDPEKYQDAVLHDRYLDPLSDYHRQFLFVLNQVDRLAPGEIDDLVGDLAATLMADGIPEPVIVPVAADPDLGPPIGIDRLIDHLERMVDVKRVVYQKLATDLTQAARAVTAAPELAGAVGFEPRWESVRERAAAAVASGDRRGGVGVLQSFVDELGDEVGGGARAALEEVVSDQDVSRAVEVAYESSGAFRTPQPPPAPRWTGPVRWGLAGAAALGVVWAVVAGTGGGEVLWPVVMVVAAVAAWVALGSWVASHRTRAAAEALTAHRSELEEPIARALDQHLGRSLRGVLRKRAAATAAATELGLALTELERRLGR